MAKLDDSLLDPSGRAQLSRLAERLSCSLSTLADKPEEDVESTLGALWQCAAGHPMSAERACAQALTPLDASAVARLEHLVEQRLAGVPLAHLTGRQSFLGHELLAGPEALVPRKETEILGHLAVALLGRLAQTRSRVLVADVCTGSGNLAIALALAEPRAQVHACDISPECVDLTRRNAEYRGVADRVFAHAGDLLDPLAAGGLERGIDLLVCNPPYISSARVTTMPEEISGHEPRLAFDGGPFGVRIVTRLCTEAPRVLRPDGWIAFEVGLGQAESIRRRLARDTHYADIGMVADPQGEPRVLYARCVHHDSHGTR